jgi:DNA-binding CsgD family transcriptional regulator
MEQKEYLWNHTIEDILNGYQESKDKYTCVFCKEERIKGRIYPIKEEFFDSFGAIREHIINTHGHTVDYLLSKDPALVGISDVQQLILKLMSEGKEDKVIASEIGIAQSTVRNHRFKLREKEKQAKLYLTLMLSLEEKISRSIHESDNGLIEEIHQSATMIDDRYNITEGDRKKTIATYMDENGAIKQFPSKEKKKIILLGEVMKNFVKNREYNENEVNLILKRIYADFSTIRRALIEYGFLERSDDCSVYRVKE